MRGYFDNYDKLCIEQFYNNHLRSQSHTNNIRTKTYQYNENNCFYHGNFHFN